MMQISKQETQPLSVNEKDFQTLLEAINTALQTIARNAKYYQNDDTPEQYLIPVERELTSMRCNIVH